MPAAKKVKRDSKMEICGEKKVKEAINALKLLNKKFIEKELKKQPLLENATESPIHLQIILKKIPPPQLLRMIRVSLPHSLIAETSEVCLITGDLEKCNHKAEIEPTVLHYKDLLKKHGITNVAQVIPLRQLRTVYKTFESKRQLAAAYDVFLVDKKIAGVVPKTLGKSFFQTRKFPIQIDMNRPNLKDQIDKALCQTGFSLTCRGNSYAMEVARLSMEDDAILENLMASIEVLGNKLPGKENNILSLYLKTAKSKAIPIYVSLDIPDDILIKKPRKSESIGIDELSTIDNAQVKVFRDGRVILKKVKKESSSHEEDENVNLNEPYAQEGDMVENEVIQESIGNEVSIKKKMKGKKNSDLIEITENAEFENEKDTQESTANEVSIKKKKKGKKTSDLIQIIENAELENEKITQDSVADETSPKKKKKAKKSISLYQIAPNSQIENEAIQDSFTIETSSKKKKGKKHVDHISDIGELKTVEGSQDSPSGKASSKQKNKKNINSSHVEVDEALEDVGESGALVNSKKLKTDESDNVSKKAKKFQKKDMDISQVAEESINVKTPKSKKGKKKTKDVIDSAKKEISLISIEDEEIMPNQKTPSRTKKGERESIEAVVTPLTSSVSKRKRINVDSDVKNNLESSSRKSISLSAKKVKN